MNLLTQKTITPVPNAVGVQPGEAEFDDADYDDADYDDQI